MRTGFIRSLVKKVLSDSGIASPPILVKDVAEAQGFDLIYYPFPEEVSAVVIKDEKLFAIGVNQNHHPNRQRFSIAHELGHYLLDHKQDLFVKISNLDFVEKKDDSNKLIENEANQFASELLIPIDMIKNDFAKDDNVQMLAKQYKVSEQAMFIRLMNLKLI